MRCARRYVINRRDGRIERWVGYASTIGGARAVRDAQPVIEGFPVIIRKLVGTRAGEEVS